MTSFHWPKKKKKKKKKKEMSKLPLRNRIEGGEFEAYCHT